MRHSDPKLTANVYTDPRLLDVYGAVEALPMLSLTMTRQDAPETMRATGTMGAPIPSLYLCLYQLPANRVYWWHTMAHKRNTSNR